MRIPAAVLLAGGLLLAPPAQAQEFTGTCPDVVVLAARGSEQNEHLEPTRYHADSPWTSNGFEAENIRAFLHFAEARNPGTMQNVQVLGLDDTVYPARLPLPALAGEDEDLDALQMSSRVGTLLSSTPPHVIVGDALGGLVGGLHSGITGTMGFVDAWEESTGCTPGYLLVGYSQGAVVLVTQERALHERGQLVGALYFGSPGGVPGASISNRHRHCLDGDFACHLTSSNLGDALGSGGGVHNRYFLDVDETATEEDAHVADTFAGWVTGYTAEP